MTRLLLATLTVATLGCQPAIKLGCTINDVAPPPKSKIAAVLRSVARAICTVVADSEATP